MKRVFLSYSRDDEAIARELQKHLPDTEVLGMGATHSLAGDFIKRNIKESLQKASAIVVLVSDRSMQSQWVQFEVGAALDMGKLIIPLLVGGPGDETNLPEWLGGITYIDARGRSVRQAAKEMMDVVMQQDSSSDE